MRKLIGLLVLILPAYGSAQVLDITVFGDYRPTPVAIVPFGWEGQSGAMPLDMAAVITADLKRSGRFDPIGVDKMLQQPTDGSDVDFQDWNFVGVEAVAVGKFEQLAENRFALRVELFDVVSRRLLVVYRKRDITRTTMRETAHRAADVIYEKLTGIKGVFNTRVAYVTAKQQGDKRLYSLVVADQDGHNQYTMLEQTAPIMSPSWSPDSRQLAYVSFEGNKSSIYVQTLRTGNRFVVSSRPGINGAPSFSPDGRNLVVTLGGVDGNPDIYVININTRQARRLTTHRAIDTEGTWSPDGRYIYFTSDRSGGPQIYRVAATGGSPERVTFEGSYNARPRLSPDGKKLAVVHNDRGNFRIGVMDLESKFLHVLSKGRQDESPSFAPNSDILIYATRVGRDGVLETVSADGLIRQKMSVRAGGDVREPVWSPFPRF